jgi:curved DNA-binding protein CbpA
MNPYQELGLNPNCSQDEIKQQYRTLAHLHHPDRGGDAERFKRINLAYEILSDSVRRAEYDRTGQFDQKHNIRGTAIERLANMINHYVPDLNADAEDLITKMRMDIHQALNQLASNTENVRRQLNNAQRTHKKLWVKTNGENFLKGFVENVIARRENELVDLERLRATLTLMLEMLDDYHFGDNEWRLMIESVAQ